MLSHFKKVTSMVEQAVSDGATVSYGWKSEKEWVGLDVYDKQAGYFFPPTILTDLDDSFEICNEEVFGPIACVMPFDTEEEVILKANRLEYRVVFKNVRFIQVEKGVSSDFWQFSFKNCTKPLYGLCGTVHSQNASRIHRVASQLDTGTVWVNSWLVRDLRMPFGGFKHSGTGREGAHDSEEFFTEQKCISICY